MKPRTANKAYVKSTVIDTQRGNFFTERKRE